MCWISMEIGRQIITVDEAEDGIRRRNAWNTPTPPLSSRPTNPVRMIQPKKR